MSLAAVQEAPAAVRWRVPRLFAGQTVTVIAGGPSLTSEDARRAQSIGPVIAVNDAYRKAPNAAIHYAADGDWWCEHWEVVRRLPGIQVTCDARASLKVAEAIGLHVVELVGGPEGRGLSLDPARIHSGRNSGYQALNIAVLTGAARVLLLGFDMQRTGGRAHWFGDHPANLRNPDTAMARNWVREFDAVPADAARAGCEIINCSRETALTVFPRMPIEDVL